MIEVIRGKDGRWLKPCLHCGKMQSYLRRYYAVNSLKLNKFCKVCTKIHNKNCNRGFYKEVRVSWFNKTKSSARSRMIPFKITIKDVSDLYEKQKGKCNLTGWSITFPKVGHSYKTTVSVDRIDSSKAYTKDNIQLLHKDVNMLKNSYEQDYFIKICKAIAKKVRNGKARSVR